MRAGWKNGRNQDHVGPGPPGGNHFAQIVRRPAFDASETSYVSAMRTGTSPTEIIATCSQQNQPSTACQPMHLRVQRASGCEVETIMPKNHATAARHPIERIPKRVTHALIRH